MRALKKRFVRLARMPVARQSIGIFALLFLGTLTLTVHGTALIVLLASGASSLNDATTTLFFTPRGTETLSVGEMTEVDINISTKVPVNAIGATISFPPDSLEIVGISKKDSFVDLWTEDTLIKESSGEVRFSGGTTASTGLLGSGTILTLTVKAKKPAYAKLQFSAFEVYPHDGSGERITSTSRTLTYRISEPAPAGSGTMISAAPPPRAPSPDLNDDGRVNLVDVSIMTFRLLGTYNSRYDLNVDGALGLADLSIVLTNFR